MLEYKHGANAEHGAVSDTPAIIYSVRLTVVFSFLNRFLPYVNTVFVVCYFFYSVLRSKLPFEDFDGDKFSTFPVSKAFSLIQ